MTRSRRPRLPPPPLVHILRGEGWGLPGWHDPVGVENEAVETWVGYGWLIRVVLFVTCALGGV